MATDEKKESKKDEGPILGALPQSVATRLPSSIVIVGVFVVALVISPVLWLFLRASQVDYERAVSLITSDTTVDVFVNSFLLVVAVTFLSILIGVPLAYLTVRTDLPFKRFWTVVVSLPLVIPSYLGAFAFVSVFSRQGTLQNFLEPFGVESVPSIFGFHGAVIVLTLYTYPYIYITTRASFKTFDTTLIDAARTLNHSRWEAFKRIALPHILPAVGAGSLLVSLYTLSDFGTPAILRFDTFTRVIYSEFKYSPGYAALLSIQLLLLTLLILGFESRFGANRKVTGTAGRRSDTVSLGKWRWVAMIPCVLIALFALVIPLGILGSWFLRDTPGIESYQFQWGYAINSVTVSVGAAIAATAAAIPVAYLSARYKNRFTRFLERSTYIGYATPGIVLGIALVFLGLSYAPFLYQTFALLIFAYVVRFLPQAVGSTRASLLQVNPQLKEAARSLGRSSFDAFREVTLPLIAPGVLAGAALVFLTTMKELPATLILRPPGFETLVTHSWDVITNGYYGYAAIPAFMLVIISAVSMIVILSREGYDVK